MSVGEKRKTAIIETAIDQVAQKGILKVCNLIVSVQKNKAFVSYPTNAYFTHTTQENKFKRTLNL